MHPWDQWDQLVRLDQLHLWDRWVQLLRCQLRLSGLWDPLHLWDRSAQSHRYPSRP